ncbi:MAG TPA: fumarylacetoacetate hydrolase family protein [Terriglobales bacterium]|nr:fumarylacetoacetate hydrolase family protein [Terriglobales bacterium]
MFYCRFQYRNTTCYGLIESVAGKEVITRTLAKAPQSFTEFEGAEKSETPLSEVRLLAPVEPSKVVCIGRNYREHAKELDHPIPTEPLIFLKPPSSVIGPEEAIRRPAELSQRVDYEAELGVVIGNRCYRLRASDDVRPYIAGYTCVNDVTARDLQNKDGQWTRAKGFDTFCPIGPVVAEGLNPWKGVGVQSRVNGELRQNGVTTDFLFPLDVLMHFISQVMTLEPGDVIATGTPVGVGPLKAGDVVEVTVEGVGTLRNPVMDR